jgi:D-methionine transport system permease protein
VNSENIDLILHLIPLQLWNTIFMVCVATFFAVLIGVPLGIILTITGKGHIKEQFYIYKILEGIVNIGRSFPYAILMVALIPFTRWIVGTSLGTAASIVPLSIAAIPFLARLVESSLKEVDAHIVEAATVMGSTTWQMIIKVLLPEALPSMIAGITLTMISIIGYSAMAGLVGGGGLGQVAIQYGYNRFNTVIMIVTIVLLLFLVQTVQWIGGYIAKAILIKRGKVSHE